MAGITGGIRGNPDLGDGPATKYVGYFQRANSPSGLKASRIPQRKARAFALVRTPELHSIAPLVGYCCENRRSIDRKSLDRPRPPLSL
jgi:hypothetical protein